MSVEIHCDCGRSYRLSDKKRGLKVRCKDCGQILIVPNTKRSKPPPTREPPVEATEELPPRKTVSKTTVRTRTRSPMPLASTFDDLFAGGTSTWSKVLGGAVATPVAVVFFALGSNRGGANPLPRDPAVIVIILGACAVVGAILGGVFALKDITHARLASGKRVPLALKLLFGFGVWSLMLWFPLLVVVIIAVLIVVL